MATDFSQNLSALFLCNEDADTDGLEHELNAYVADVSVGSPDLVSGAWVGSGARLTTPTNRFSGDTGESTLITNKIPKEDYTVAFWFYPNTTAGVFMVGGPWNNPFYWNFRTNGASPNKMTFSVYDDMPSTVTVTSDGSISTSGVWYLCVGGYNASSDSIFVSLNGEAQATVSLAGEEFNKRNDMLSRFLWGGNTSGSISFNGRTDQIGVWPGWAWSDSEIDEYWNGGAGIEYPFPVPDSGVGPNHAFMQNFLRRRRRR